jgi:hypothetical protein
MALYDDTNGHFVGIKVHDVGIKVHDVGINVHDVGINVHDVGRPRRGAPTQTVPNNHLLLPRQNIIVYTPVIFCYGLGWM